MQVDEVAEAVQIKEEVPVVATQHVLKKRKIIRSETYMEGKYLSITSVLTRRNKRY